MTQQSFIEALHKPIAEIADGVYGQTADTFNLDPSMVHKIGRCRTVAPLFLHALMENGAGGLRIDSRQGRKVDEHKYVVGENEAGEEFVIDGTWQQFVPEEQRSEELPKVLVGTRHEVTEFARLHGVDEANLEFWAPKGKFEEPDNRTPAEKIAAHFDSVY